MLNRLFHGQIIIYSVTLEYRDRKLSRYSLFQEGEEKIIDLLPIIRMTIHNILPNYFCLSAVILKILVEHTGLYALVILIFARRILVILAFNGVVENLTDLHVGVNANGMYTMHF